MTGPRWVFSHDDLSIYERIDPREFADEIDSRDIVDRGAPDHMQGEDTWH